MLKHKDQKSILNCWAPDYPKNRKHLRKKDKENFSKYYYLVSQSWPPVWCIRIWEV